MPGLSWPVRALIALAALLAALLGRPVAFVSADSNTAPITAPIAAPPAPIPQTIPQPDGSSFEALPWGDEWFHGLETLDGYTVLRDETTGFWVYAAPDGATLSASRDGTGPQPLVVGRDDPRDLPRHLRPLEAGESIVSKKMLANLSATNSGLALDGTRIGPAVLAAAESAPVDSTAKAPAAALSATQANLGTQKVLVLLVEFSNRYGTYPASTFAGRWFGATGSVRAFYQQASYGKLDLQPAAETHGTVNDGMIGWLRMAYPHPGASSSATIDSPKIVTEALVMADPYINFASYDTNRDTFLSTNELHLIVILAGYEKSFGGAPTPYVWAHRWAVDAGGYHPKLDNVWLGQSSGGGGFAMFGEIHTYLSNGAQVNPHAATIGVMAHELGHDLDWPDLYDTNNASFGVGTWSIMGSGSWNTLNGGQSLYGDSPALPDAFLKWYQGWLTPKQASAEGQYGLTDAAGNAAALLIGANPSGVDWDYQNHAGSGDYWLAENRNRTGFDAALPGCGLLVWHVDESVTFSNTANANRDHPLIGLVQADGRNDLYNNINSGDAGDPFPGSSANTALTTVSNPALRANNGAIANGLGVLSPTCAGSMTVYYSGSGAATQGFKINLPLVKR